MSIGVDVKNKMKKIEVVRKGFSIKDLENQFEKSKNPCGCGGMCTYD